MTMHPDENARFDFIAPYRQIGMIGVDDFLGFDLRVFRTIVRHRDDENFRNLGRKFQDGPGLFGRVVVPIPQHQGTGENRRIFSREHGPGHFFHRFFFRHFMTERQAILRQRGKDTQFGRGGRMKSRRTRFNYSFQLCCSHLYPPLWIDPLETNAILAVRTTSLNLALERDWPRLPNSFFHHR